MMGTWHAGCGNKLRGQKIILSVTQCAITFTGFGHKMSCMHQTCSAVAMCKYAEHSVLHLGCDDACALPSTSQQQLQQ